MNLKKKCCLMIFGLFAMPTIAFSQVTVQGELKKWHTVTLVMEGPETNEMADENPFLNYRLQATFRHADTVYTVPGYFAADGDAAETSATSGKAWKVHFSPDHIGSWAYSISFRKGHEIAVSHQNGQSAGYMDGMVGSFTVLPTDKAYPDFRARGRLTYVGDSYLQFQEKGEYFLKAGADAPENLLSYADFDGDFANDGHKDDLVKTWSAHVRDWKSGDPSWQGGKGKGLIGAVNYLASKGMNVFSFLTLNIAGDDQNVFPYVDYDTYDRIDISKLAQWEILFAHAQSLGLFLHFKTSEVENQGLLDQGALGTHRQLYYRELIARFGHHLALNWNIGEENGQWMKDHPTPWQTTRQRLDCAQYFYDNDPYRHHLVIHNGQGFYDLLGPESKYSGISLQTSKEDFSQVHGSILYWKMVTKRAKKTWPIAIDEPGDHRLSLVPDAVDPDHNVARQNALWGSFLAGSWGIEWYFGYENVHSDLTCEDWRSRDAMWDQSRYALQFFAEKKIPFWKMQAADDETDDPNDWVFRAPNEEYVIFKKEGKKSTTRISNLTGDFDASWYNPRSGEWHGELKSYSVDGTLDIEQIAEQPEKDWVLHLRKRQ